MCMVDVAGFTSPVPVYLSYYSLCVWGGDRKVEILPVIMLKTISSRTVLFEAFPPPITSLLGTKTSVINARYTVY